MKRHDNTILAIAFGAMMVLATACGSDSESTNETSAHQDSGTPSSGTPDSGSSGTADSGTSTGGEGACSSAFWDQAPECAHSCFVEECCGVADCGESVRCLEAATSPEAEQECLDNTSAAGVGAGGNTMVCAAQACGEAGEYFWQYPVCARTCLNSECADVEGCPRLADCYGLCEESAAESETTSEDELAEMTQRCNAWCREGAATEAVSAINTSIECIESSCPN